MARGPAPAPLVGALAVAASIVLLLLPLPAKEAFASSIGPILFFPAARATAFVESLRRLRGDNRALRLELASRLIEEARLLELAEQNSRLRRMVGLQATLPPPLVPALVVARPGGRMAGEYLALDVGSLHGAETGSCVVSIDGLVGRLITVRPERSLVRTLLSPECRVSVVVERTGAGGILRPDHLGAFLVPDIPLVDEVAPGDTLVTSGLGGVFPRGLRVGLVTSVDNDLRLQLHSARAVSLVRFDEVREVFIMGSSSADTAWSGDASLSR